MATYSEVSITGYNSNPPEDDGTQASSNEVSWAKHKIKLGDPIKTALETTQTNITTLAAAIAGELSAPTGTLMLFQQTSAPTGWTKQTTHNDKALRIVSGTASSGGTTAFSSVLTSRTILQANLPSANLSHSLVTTTNNADIDIKVETGSSTLGHSSSSQVAGAATTGSFTNAPISPQGHSHNVSGTISLGGSGTAMDFAVQYVDVIIASKDA